MTTPFDGAGRVLTVLRECFHKWEDYPTDVYCPIGGCEFKTNGPKDGGSGFVTLELYLHLMTHSAEQLEAHLG